MTKCHAMAPSSKRAGFEQRIFHPGGLLLHGHHRLLNFDRTHPLGAQVAHFLDLQEVKERIAFGGRKQAGLLPRGQLSRAHAKNPDQIFSTVSIHVSGTSATYYRKVGF